MSSVNAAGAPSGKRITALALAVIGALFLILGVIYLAIPAKSLPAILGQINGSNGHHALRMAASFAAGVILLGAAWLVNRRGGTASASSASADASAQR
jgi:hypothetical protein